jgi:hypothetical protein
VRKRWSLTSQMAVPHQADPNWKTDRVSETLDSHPPIMQLTAREHFNDSTPGGSMQHTSFWETKTAQLVRKFPAFYGTQRFINVFTTVCHNILSWVRQIQYTSPNYIYVTSVLILLSHLHQLLLYRSSTLFYRFVIFSMHATYTIFLMKWYTE